MPRSQRNKPRLPPAAAAAEKPAPARRSHSGRAAKQTPAAREDEAGSAPRIIGGELRHRRLECTLDSRTRPMKDRVRESLFDLIGTDVKRAIAIDLFAGSGAIGFEALSRGAAQVIFAERHFPTADAISRNARALGVEDRIDVRAGDVLLWAKRLPPLPQTAPWLIFISPPWSFFSERWDELLALLQAMLQAAPSRSTFVVEADVAFDPLLLPRSATWEARPMPPAVLYFQIKDGA